MLHTSSPISPNEIRKAELRAALHDVECLVGGKAQMCVREIEGIQGSDDLVLMKMNRMNGEMLNRFKHHVPF